MIFQEFLEIKDLVTLLENLLYLFAYHDSYFIYLISKVVNKLFSTMLIYKRNFKAVEGARE